MNKVMYSNFNVKMNEQTCVSGQAEQPLGRHSQRKVVLGASGDSVFPEIPKPSFRSAVSSKPQEIREGLLLSSLVCSYFIVYSFDIGLEIFAH